MALFRKVFSYFSTPPATGGTIGPCYSGISSPPPPPVEELETRHGFGPWLMFADEENDKTGGTGVRRCYSFLSGEIFSIPAPQLQGRRCWGTQSGWVIAFRPSDGDVHLFNPLTHHQLPLPSRRTFKKLRPSNDRTPFFNGFSLSSNSDRLVVMAMYGGTRLAFSSPGDKAWMSLNESETTDNFDTIFYCGQFYSIDRLGKLKVWDFTSRKPQEKLITTIGVHRTRESVLYLVEIAGHLNVICRYYMQTITRRFEIYRFDFQTNRWMFIDDLDGHSLFVGNNTTFAISATDYPGIKPDCIYFTDDFSEDYIIQSFCDTGFYDYFRKILVSYLTDEVDTSYSRFSRPFFFIPSRSSL